MSVKRAPGANVPNTWQDVDLSSCPVALRPRNGTEKLLTILRRYNLEIHDAVNMEKVSPQIYTWILMICRRVDQNVNIGNRCASYY